MECFFEHVGDRRENRSQTSTACCRRSTPTSAPNKRPLTTLGHASLANEHTKGTTASKSEIDLDQELREIDQLRSEISFNAQRLARAFY